MTSSLTDIDNHRASERRAELVPAMPNAADESAVRNILTENDRRNEAMYAPFNPVTGEGSIGERVQVSISDFAIPVQWLPAEMMDIPFVSQLVKAGSIDKFLSDVLHVEPNEIDHDKVAENFIRLRYRHDFPFWAATLVWIHNKDAGADVLFRLRYPQRILVSRFEEKRKAGLPIRLILLKARQWGGSAHCYLLIYLNLLQIKTLSEC